MSRGFLWPCFWISTKLSIHLISSPFPILASAAGSSVAAQNHHRSGQVAVQVVVVINTSHRSPTPRWEAR